MKVEIKEHNIKKVLNDVAYIEFDDKNDSVDYCLGSSLKESGEICRLLLNYQKMQRRKSESV